MGEKIKLTVYGAEVLCPSCVNLPSSKEQYGWLQAAITRKYGENDVTYKYIDIFNPPEEQPYKGFAERVIEEDMFYPVVLIEDEIVGEGNPRLKTVYRALEDRGLQPQ
ncbi:YuzD family protein [Tenuibacillus multivorans]|uniref:Disulfide oxidoreductase YuzD n=1 Tax=Tenuibacillus multivorans TaxID=237069 RepID=A0A1H0FT97_9BACI|nr:YuzD family protein [Tenuibacillus multivorans]GEL77889.1 disulfide oxidoreductase [Tenuibacillus multivorans]SDN97898.1 Disulfide oxidoreductase YuzD [Tenuibacillus multivorans]